MILDGYIKDNDGYAVPYATVTVYSESGSTILRTTANGSGYYKVNFPPMDGVFLLSITSAEHNPEGMYFDYSGDTSNDFILQRKVTVIDPVIVTNDPRPKQNYIPMLVAMAVVYKQHDSKNAVGNIDKSDVQTGIYIVGGIFMITAFKKLMEKLNIFSGPGQDAVNNEQTNPKSPWKPVFLDHIPAGTNYLLLTSAKAAEFSKIIHNAFTVVQDNYNSILGVFNQLKTQSQVAHLSKVFQQTYNEDLLTFLTDGGGILPWDGLSDTHLKELTDLVKNLPQYKV